MIINETCIVIDNKQIADNIYEAHLESDKISKETRPGQFINILPNENFTNVMRRPMSVSYQDEGSIKIVYKIVGTGTRLISDWKSGDRVDIIGPLGNTWPKIDQKESVLIGGGVGLAPIINLYTHLESENTYLFLGARNKNEHFIEHDEKNRIYLATDDGSIGIPGNLFDAVKKTFSIDELREKVMYVCGPPIMMEVLRNYSIMNGIECYLALETIMACGIGICQGCTVEKSSHTNSINTYREKYGLVCIDGPIFKADEIKTCFL